MSVGDESVGDVSVGMCPSGMSPSVKFPGIVFIVRVAPSVLASQRKQKSKIM